MQQILFKGAKVHDGLIRRPDMLDLHMHSRYSDDGEFSPASLAAQCHLAGITLMSLTDHNCAHGNHEAQAEADKLGIQYVPGIEVDCTFEGVNFHVLGYGINYKSPDFLRIEEDLKAQEEAASLQKLKLTQDLGFDIKAEELMALAQDSHWPKTWTGEMFGAILLCKEEYKDHPLLLPYREGGARAVNPCVSFYWDYYAQGKPCYAHTIFPQMKAVIDIIHQNGGISVLAHPGINLKGREDLLPGIVDLGLCGIEAFSSYHSPEMAVAYVKKAREHQLLITCGSDYHGKSKPAVRLLAYGELNGLDLAAPFLERLSRAQTACS